MAREICNHEVFPSLREKLTSANIVGCPTCLLQLHVVEIAETRAALERRGGVFASKATAIDQLENDNRKDFVAHKTLMRRWRLAKIDLHKDLTLLEGLRSEGVCKPQWELQLDKAFGFWKEKEIESSTVPGYMLKEDDDFLASEERQDADFDALEEPHDFKRTRVYKSPLPVSSESKDRTISLSMKRKRLSASSSGSRLSKKPHIDNRVRGICDASPCSSTTLATAYM